MKKAKPLRLSLQKTISTDPSVGSYYATTRHRSTEWLLVSNAMTKENNK